MTDSRGSRGSRGRSRKDAFLSEQRFDALPIDARSLRALAAAGITHLSRPQAEYLPAALVGADVVVRAPTGSGKTLGFLLPVMQLVAALPPPPPIGPPAARPIVALVLSPTRDLALQTAAVAARLLEGYAGRGVLAIVGGDAKIGRDQARLAREPCDVVVGTPGRLMAHLQQTAGFRDRLRGVRALVIDEADSMLGDGFLPAVRTIVAALPPASAAAAAAGRQTLLFTATLNDGVRRIVAELTRPGAVVEFDAGPSAANSAAGSQGSQGIRCEIRVLPPARLVPEAVRLIARHARETGGAHKVLAFVSTVRHVKFLAALLRSTGHPLLRGTLELHSGLSSGQRAAAVAALERGSGVVMVASDVAGRGLDVSDISLVVQIGIALDVAQVVHRAGRTGRGGKGGLAVALVGDDEAPVAAG